MKRFCILILFFIVMNNTISAQLLDESPFNVFDREYSQLYNELFEIVKNEFVMPIRNNELIFVYNEYVGYGPHFNPFVGRVIFINVSYLQCNYGTPIFSMTPGIIKDIILGRKIIIEYNDIEISYWYLEINDDIKVGDSIGAGQLLGTNCLLEHAHSDSNGIVIKIKYKSFYFDIGYIFNTIGKL